MFYYNYSKVCQELLKDLPPRQREVLSRRFGLKTGERETLEAIGKSYGICRERIRQIEEDGRFRLKSKIERHPSTTLQKIFQYFTRWLKDSGDLRKEDTLLSELGGKTWRPQVYFLLTLENQFKRFPESDDFYPLWTINQNSLILAKKVINSFYNQLKKLNRPISIEEATLSPPTPRLRPFQRRARMSSYLEISKKIQKNSEGLFGLKDWPEINPRGIKDKAYLVFKKEERPLHFAEVTGLIQSALAQTVHNELIKDSRFVLVGRGIYALKEWGYEEGQVKDIIFKVLKEAKRPLTKEEILEEVLKQRLVKENTILLNLSNKKYFLRTPKGYITKKA